MIHRHEVEAAVALNFYRRTPLRLKVLTGGIDFVVYRVDFEQGESVVFRGQRNYVSGYLGPLNFGRILAGEIRFYEQILNLPVPQLINFEPDESRLGFPYAFFTCLPGEPLSDLLIQAANDQRRSTMKELGRLLGTIHQVGMKSVGRLAHETANTWAEYMAQRLRRRLQPHVSDGLMRDSEMRLILQRASALEHGCPRLLHMDFRPENILAKFESGSITVTGIVDGANALAGDPAMDLARLEEGTGYDADFSEGYENVAEPIDRQSDSYFLYRLETAALLAHVYEGTSEAEHRYQRFAALRAELVQRLS